MRCTVGRDGGLYVALARSDRDPIRVRLLPPFMEGEDAVDIVIGNSSIAFCPFDEKDARAMAEFLAYYYPSSLDYGINIATAIAHEKEEQVAQELASIGQQDTC